MTSRFGKFARSIVVLILVASTLLVLAGKAITESFSTAFPSEPIISDQTFVFNPDLFGFDVAGFLSKQSSSLAGYTEVLDGETVTAADLIASKAHYYSINPQVFLTLLEVRWGAVSAGSAGNPPLFAAGGGPATMSLDAELEAMAQSLFIAYYGFLDDPASQAGTSSGLNAGTVAIASYLGQAIQDSTALEQALGSGPQGFSGLYALLFGDPMAGDLVNQGPQTPMAGARLPWAAGGVWNYNSGPHRYQGGQYNPLCPWGAPGCPGPWSSLDFGTMNPVSCNPNTPDDDGKYSPDWVAAARGGDAYYGGEKGAIKIHHSDGWITYYVHLGQTDLLPTSTTSPTPVNEGDHLGHPSCQGNTSGIHLHFAVNYNGQFQSVNGTNLGGWTVVESLYHYNGTMTCPDGRVKTASSARYESSKIVDDCQPSAGSALSVVLIIDSTGSMASNDPNRLRVEAAKAFIDASQVGDEIGIVDFQSTARVLAPMTVISSDADKAALKSAADQVYNGGSTNINAGLNTGFTTLSGASGTGQKRAAILLTDGGHNVGAYNDQSHLQYAGQGWAVHTVALGQADLSLMAKIAAETGGECVNNCMALTNASDLGLFYQSLLSGLTNSNAVTTKQIPIQQGQQTSVAASISPNQYTSQFYIGWEGSEMDLALITPGGQIIDPDNLPANVTHAKGATYELYRVDFPQSGQWTMSIYGKDVPPGGEMVNVHASTSGLNYQFQPFSMGAPPVPATTTPVPPTLTPVPDSTITPTPTAGPGSWQPLGAGSASAGGISQNAGESSRPSMAIVSDNSIYLAWNNLSGSDREVYVRHWNGSTWGEVGSGSATGGGISNNAGESTIPSLAVASDGSVYVAWSDTSDGDAEIYVRRYVNGAWSEVGAGSASGGGVSNNAGESEKPSIAIGSDGNPYVAWHDSSGGDVEIYVRRWNGSSWIEVGASSATGGGISNNGGNSFDASVVVGQDGNPYVSWGDGSGGDSEVYVRRWNGSSWIEVGGGSASGGGISNNSAISQNPFMTRSGTDFYVVWVDESNGNFEIYLRRWNGSAWETAGGNSASGGGISNTSGDSRAPTIYVAPNGKVYVAWYDNTTGDYEIYVRGLTGGTWQEVGLSSASAGGISANAGASSHPIVKTSPGNIPVVAWADDSGGNYEIYVLKYPNP